jgi:hypothetical protein
LPAPENAPVMSRYGVLFYYVISFYSKEKGAAATFSKMAAGRKNAIMQIGNGQFAHYQKERRRRRNEKKKLNRKWSGRREIDENGYLI